VEITGDFTRRESGMKTGKSLTDGALKQAVDWLFHDQMFATFKQHGNTTWSFSTLVTMALLWAWGADEGLQQRFRSGLAILPHLYRRRQWGTTYQGFIKILKTWTARLLPVVIARLRERMQEVAGAHWTIHGWVVLAVDGTRIEAPRTKANEAHFASSFKRRRRKQKTSGHRQSKPKRKTHPPAPQVWLTVMWHVGTGLLWDWRRGPNSSSERAHLLEMLDALPDKTLVTADAGFQGYEYWNALLERGSSFVIRVGGNVRLLKGLGHVRRDKNIVSLWPDTVRKCKQPPIVLRLIEFHAGRRSICLVTNVLDHRWLSEKQVLEIYRRRWGVEVFIRGFKQTFGHGKLRSHAPHNVEMELDWSLVALWSLELLAVRELLIRGQAPCDLSTAGAIRAVRHALQCAVVGVDFELTSQLAAIRHDGYQRRRKNIRKWPQKRTKARINGPCIRLATFEEVEAAYELQKPAA
jgi:hypothetical protein